MNYIKSILSKSCIKSMKQLETFRHKNENVRYFKKFTISTLVFENDKFLKNFKFHSNVKITYKSLSI